MNELVSLFVNSDSYVVGHKPLSEDLYEIIEPYMGHDFARYVQNEIEKLQEKTEQEYWQNHSDEQAYEEELNEMCNLLDELWDYFAEIKEIANNKYKNMPEWGYIAEEGMDLINKNR